MCVCVLCDGICISCCLQQDQQQPQEAGQDLPSAAYVCRQRFGAGKLVSFTKFCDGVFTMTASSGGWCDSVLTLTPGAGG